MVNAQHLEIRDKHLKLYNGKGLNMNGWYNCKDKRFIIEERNGGIQLRGDFPNEERIFKLSTYRDIANKEKHSKF